MSNRMIEAVLRLSARLGNMSAFGALEGKMAAVDAKARAFNRTQGLIASSSRTAMAATARYIAPAAIAYGATAATKEFASLERRMTRIGINANASSAEMQDAMGGIRKVAEELHMPVENVISGLESLIASGKSLGEAMALLPSVSATAQAADADNREMAATADAISSAFGIAADKMSGAFDIIAHGGKMGKFELKDMASELPSLAPAFAALGYRGEEGLKRLTAALQVVRMEVGTSGEAATSFMDVISKMETDTVSNNFKKFGVNIRKEMKRARSAGEDTLEAFLRLSREAVKGDMSKLPQLFTDKQMLIGMRALMNRLPELRGMIGDLGNAAGTVFRDNERLANDAQAAIDKMGNSWERLKISLGKGLVDAGAVDALDAVSNDLDKGAAIRKALADMGMDYWERENWLFWNTFNKEAKDAMAFRGGYRTEQEKNLADAHQKSASDRAVIDTPERDPSLGPEVRSMPDVGPIPHFFRNADGTEIATVPLPSAAASTIPVPTPRPSQTDLEIDARDAERAAVVREMEREGLARDPGEVTRDLEAAFPDGRRTALDTFLVPPQVFPFEAADRTEVADLRSITDASALMRALEDAGSAVGGDLARGGADAAGALTNAAPTVGATIGDAAASKIAADAAMAGNAFGNAAAARIREAAGLIRVQAVAAPQPGGVSGNRGVAMPGAGETVSTP